MAGIIKVNQYQDFNGNSIMTSDGNGNITVNNNSLKNTPAFALHFDGGFPTAVNTQTKLSSSVITNMLYNKGNAFDQANAKFVVPNNLGGLYYFGCTFLTLNNANNYRGRYYKNGSSTQGAGAIQARSSEGDSGYTPTHNFTVLDLVPGDYIEYYIENTTAANAIYNPGDDNFNIWFGFKLIGS